MSKVSLFRSAIPTGNGSAIAPAGLGEYDSSWTPDSASVDTATKNALYDTSAAQSEAERQALERQNQQIMGGLNLIGQAIGATGNAVLEQIRSANRVELAQINSDTQREIERIRAQSGGSLSPSQQAQIDQLNALSSRLSEMMLSQQQPSNSNLPLIIGAGVVGLGLVGGLVYLIASRGPRRNPTCGCMRENPVVSVEVMSGENKGKRRKRFVSAAHLRRLRARR